MGRLIRILIAGFIAVVAQPATAQIDTAKLSATTSSQVNVTSAYKSFNRTTYDATYAFSITNNSGQALSGPVYLVFTSVTGSGVNVKGAADTTTQGQPVFVVASGTMSSAQTVSFNVLINNPQNVRFSFTTAVFNTPPPVSVPLAVDITSPQSLVTVGSTPLAIQGTISDSKAVLTVNGVPISHSAGKYSAQVALAEGHNAVVARAVNAQGQETTATISVSLDMTPPYVTIESPKDGSTVTTPTISVTGLINDIVRGTVSDGQANVKVNGKTAQVANRTYLAENITLNEGENTIQVTGADQVGNIGNASIKVTYKIPVNKRVELVSGQAQKATILTALSAPLKVQLLDENDTPVVNKSVVFRVVQGDGVLAAGTDDVGQAVLAQTDSKGEAATTFKLGSRAGTGNHRVSAKAVGFEGEVVFYASADPNPGDKVSVISGNNQRSGASQPLPLPLVVAVTDNGSNFIKGSQVEFTVTQGGGKFHNGLTTYTTTTDSDGRASAKFTLGSAVGLDIHRITAKLVGTELVAGFTASALQVGDPGATSISGVVLDNQDNPLPNVTVRVEGTTREAKSNTQGQFKITDVPVGPVHLIADGSTTTAPGEWPTLPYNIVTVAGADNTLPAPIYMVKLDTKNAVYIGKEDKEITLPEVPGFKLVVKAGSVTFPNGNKEGYLSVTPVNASKIPMPPPNGMQPQFIVTIQPTNARFDPPAQLTLPNVDGHAPGAQVEMYSFDHDLEEFVAIGLGTVSADGSIVTSNPGVGVIKAGWHCGSQPSGSGCGHSCPICQDCDSGCNCKNVDGTSDPRLKKCQTCKSGAVDDTKNPDGGPSCASIVTKLNEEEVAQAPDAGNFGQVHRLSHSAVYNGCNDGGKWCFRLAELKEKHGIGASSLGLIEITDANDSDITPLSCSAVIVDLTPVPAGGYSAAPYSTYVPLSIVLAHEQFHVSDFRDKVVIPTMNDLAAFVAGGANCTECKTDPPSTFDTKMEEFWNAHRPTYFDGNHEARAYAAENALLATLIQNIRQRARNAPAAEGWPAACQ